MSENQTVPTEADVMQFVNSIPDESRRSDARLLIDLITKVTGEPAVMWGPSIVGFGFAHLKYASGRDVDYFRVGFAPRKAHSVLYLTGGLERFADILPRLGKHSTGKGCLYLKRVADADQVVLRELVDRSYLQETD